MQDFVHLHVHTQYSLLDGQASVSRLVDKAMKDGMKGIAVTDHGNMFGIKEFTNYVNKKNSGPKGEIKDLKKRIAGIESGEIECEDKEAEIADCRAKMAEAESKLFKPIVGCEMYVARRTMDKKEGKPDQSGYHLIVLAKNEKGYHNLIKLVSHAWTRGYYMRPRTDRSELEKYHEGLIVCSACIGGEVPKKIINDQLEEAEEAVRWYKNLFGDDYYLELQRHKATVPRANHEAYPLQQKANAKLLELARKYDIKVICSNDVHFVDEENAEAHDRLICLSTGKDLDDPTRMLYTKQEWMKTKAEMNALFEDVPEALSNTLEILDKVEYYSIDHAPIMPTFAIPEDFGTEEGYRQKYTEKDLFDEFTQDENGKVVLDEDAANAKIKRLGGYDKLYRIKLEADYLAKLTYDGAKELYGDPLNDEVKEIAGIEVKERVPDSVLQEADEVVNIDLTAEELIARLKSGKIYRPEKIQTALHHFFKTENILQLRELALKEVAFRVEKKVESEVLPVVSQPARRERILACISSNEHTPRHIIRKAYRLASRYSTSFTVLYVQTPRESTERISLASQRYLLNHFKLVTELGGDVLQVFSESITEAIIETCREKQITTICMGHPAFKMPQTIFQIGKYKKFLQALAEMKIDLIIIA